MERAFRAGVVAALLLLNASSALPLSAAERVSFVPWKVLDAGAAPAGSMFILYWIPSSPEEMRRSDLLTSRPLALYSARCVAMHVVRVDDEERLAALGARDLPAAILVSDGSEIARLTGSALRAAEVEALVRSAFHAREAAAELDLQRGRELRRGGNEAGATELLTRVVACRCAFPRLAREAQRVLRRMR